MSKALPNDPARLRAMAAELRTKAAKLSDQAYHAGDYAPGAFVTGRSGRTRAMDKKTDAALEKTIRLAKQAGTLRAQAAACEQKARWLEETPQREKREQLLREAEKKEKAQQRTLPILNDPAAPYHMTSAEWKKIHRDFKGLHVRGEVKVRTAMRDGSLYDVYLTDKKEVTK